MPGLAGAARCAAYGIAVLLALVWLIAGDASLRRILLDLGAAEQGDVLLATAATLGWGAEGAFMLARMTAAAKLGIGILLVTAIAVAGYQRIRFGRADDALLDVALLAAGLGAAASLPLAMTTGGERLQALMGEFIFCVAAAELARYGRSRREGNEARGVVAAAPPEDATPPIRLR
jgi:hypothetical protein